MQVCPQPLLQHFWVPGHAASDSHPSIQMPMVPSGRAGHEPCLVEADDRKHIRHGHWSQLWISVIFTEFTAETTSNMT